MTQVRLDRFENSDYHPGPWSMRVLWFLIQPLFISGRAPWPYSIKRSLLRLFGARIGKGVIIKPKVRIKYPWKLRIGDHAWIGESVWIDNLDDVTIGDHCCISQGAYLLCGNHDYTKPAFDLITRPIQIEDGAWVGAMSIVGPGAKLETESVLAAGSVGLGTLEARMVHQGNPAKPVRERQIKP